MNYDRIILDLIDRVSSLEDEVATLKKTNPVTDMRTSVQSNNLLHIGSNNRDNTKYILEGVKYGKNRLVLAIVKYYFKRNPNTTAGQLMSTFDKSLQGSLGVVRSLLDVKNSYADYERRFFCRNSEVIHTITGDCVVCTQWGAFNIGNMIARAKELGIHVTTIA